jgi:curli production assembly/transport component CsgE
MKKKNWKMEIRPTVTIAIPVLACLLAAVPGASAGASADTQSIDGILVNQTVTVAGQEFHAVFAALWSDKPGVGGYAIVLRERPSAARGTSIEVEHANRPLFRAYLPPARAQVRALAAAAVEAAYGAALDSQVQHLLPGDPDLARDEI